jgi:hypothetical protein
VGSAAVLAATIAMTGPVATAGVDGYVPMSALINGDTVTDDDGLTDAGSPISLEQYAAQRAGFTVSVVTGAAWAAMSQADFAKYQLLIVGDPDCAGGTSLASTLSSAATWAPVVMGTSGLNPLVGNRSLVGTDPEDHYLHGGGNAKPTDPNNPATAGTEHLVEGGIRFAGSHAGATGVYFDASCSAPAPDTASALNRLSTAATGFSQNDSPPCSGDVALIAGNAAFAALHDSDLANWNCSVHVTFPTYPADWQPLAIATDTTNKPTCGIDPATSARKCGEAYLLVAGPGLIASAPDLTLMSPTTSSPVGGDQTVTATVTVDGSPVPDVPVTFTVAGQNEGSGGTCSPASCRTDSAGKVSFSYHDGNGAGADTVSAVAVVNGNSERASLAQNWTAGPGGVVPPTGVEPPPSHNDHAGSNDPNPNTNPANTMTATTEQPTVTTVCHGGCSLGATTGDENVTIEAQLAGGSPAFAATSAAADPTFFLRVPPNRHDPKALG